MVNRFVKNTIFHAADRWREPFLVFSTTPQREREMDADRAGVKEIFLKRKWLRERVCLSVWKATFRVCAGGKTWVLAKKTGKLFSQILSLPACVRAEVEIWLCVRFFSFLDFFPLHQSASSPSPSLWYHISYSLCLSAFLSKKVRSLTFESFSGKQTVTSEFLRQTGGGIIKVDRKS